VENEEFCVDKVSCEYHPDGPDWQQQIVDGGVVDQENAEHRHEERHPERGYGDPRELAEGAARHKAAVDGATGRADERDSWVERINEEVDRVHYAHSGEGHTEETPSFHSCPAAPHLYENDPLQ
jgi:hypothetical protein